MQSLSGATEGCVPTCSDVSVEISHHCDRMCSHLDGCALLKSRSDVSAEIFHHCDRMCSCLDGSLPSVWSDVFPWMVVPF